MAREKKLLTGGNASIISNEKIGLQKTSLMIY
jgi:hypothetical protein